MDRMDHVINNLIEVQKEIEEIEKQPKSLRIIVEDIKGLFPKRLGRWRIVKHPVASLEDARKNVTLIVDLPTALHGGGLIDELRSSKHEVLFIPMRGSWGNHVVIESQCFREERREFPYHQTGFSGTWEELSDDTLKEVQRISDILVEVSTINETKLQETL